MTTIQSGLAADYVTENLIGRLMRSKTTGVISPAIKRMVEDTEIDAPCVLLTDDEVKDYVSNIGGSTSLMGSPILQPTQPTETMVGGVGMLFIKAFIPTKAQDAIVESSEPYAQIEKIVKSKATMIAEQHHPALVDQIAMIILAENVDVVESL